MRVIGMTRCKNEVRWLQRVFESFLPVCDHIYMLDDHSTDGSPDVASRIPHVTVYDSPFDTLHESRDKEALIRQIHADDPHATHVVHFDGDELLCQADIPEFRRLLTPTMPTLSVWIVYYWNDEETIRVDRLYRYFKRPSIFRMPNDLRWESPYSDTGLHCTNVPASLKSLSVPCNVRFLHLGYRDAADRMRKWEFYNRVDPHNTFEGEYAHCIQGDPGGPPADAALKWAGPLKLVPFHVK